MTLRSPSDVTKLRNGVLMPWLGLGVWRAEGEQAIQAVKWAVQTGYRHIDTAAIYRNEKEVGIAVKECGVNRHNLFITSKLRIHGYESAITSCEQTLKDLQTDYLDLYLIHWPMPEEGKYIETWKAFEKLYRDGKVRAIGVANFYDTWIKEIMEQCDIVPMVDQFEYHPYYQMRELHQFCIDNGIQYEAYSPLGGGAVLKDPEISKIADKYGKTSAQVILRFELQTGVVVIPKSVHKERIESNMALFDFELSQEDMQKFYAMDADKKITCRRPDMPFETWKKLRAEGKI